jgi:hypothetical protein
MHKNHLCPYLILPSGKPKSQQTIESKTKLKYYAKPLIEMESKGVRYIM